MCGIFGCSQLTDVTYRMLPHLAWEMEHRGRDSWGCTNGVDTIKRLGPISLSWDQEVGNWSEWPWAIFHTRAASTGKVSLENQHPFVVEHEGKRVVGIHNGIVNNHDDLNSKHKRDYECDSPHIFCAIAGQSEAKEVYGYGNLAWFETDAEHETPRLFFLHFNSENLHIAKLKTGEIVFASTQEPIARAAHYAGGQVDKLYATEGDQKYYVGIDDDGKTSILVKSDKCVFGTRTANYTGDTMHDLSIWGGNGSRSRHNSHHRGNYSATNSNNNGTTYNAPSHPVNINTVGERDRFGNICLRSGCTNKVTSTRRAAVLCFSCMTMLMDGLNMEVMTP